jgi:predicted RNA binding protein YcfA (HicA-like mRNA interferase family)
MARAKNTDKNTVKSKKKTDGLIPWKKGQSGNPKGRPLGSRDRRTVIMEAMKRIAEKKNMTVEEIEEALQTAGFEKAIKGSFFHYKEISDGLYGKIQDKMDITSGGKTLADVLTAAHARRKAK